MGFGNFRWRILFIIISVLLLWQLTKVWLGFTQRKSGIEAQLQDNHLAILSQKDDWSKQKIRIAVYYEALCPDSRSFFIKQLLPTYHRLPDSIQVQLIPYGKATTINTKDGYEFICQHGPIECEANIIHACSIDVLKNSSIQLEYLSCMIKNNIEPVIIMESCAKKMNIDYKDIFKCSVEAKGKELLARYGELTKALTPKVSFIPTVTLDGKSENQARILKNLLQEVCLHFKVMPKGCTV
ncbi:GILT-like protein 1 [Osmia bicornis bicornis]|uniref:GILT-like protein 1 n=1 Tax=Osmia bicornis bicornis TaxID=1437191 RepID=UPI0010F577A5|nr:GILT-like protein 1 [Osmia bicornis bicornis]